MNEELKIIIRAVTDSAKKEIEAVRKELGKIKDEAEKADQASEALRNMGKAAAVAVGAITALTAAIVNLGKSSLDLQKTQGKLISNFQALGSSAEQAQETYKNLYRFLGDDEKATEAANLLARITTETEDLKEWTTILQGAFASFGDSLPVEGLAEAANETAKVGTVTGVLADALNWAGVSEDAFNQKLATLNSEAEREVLIRNTLLGLYNNAAYQYERNNAALIAYNESQAKLNNALAIAGKYVLPLLTAFNNMAATILQLITPAIQTMVNYLVVLVQWVATAASAIASFFGGFKGADSATNSVNTLGASLNNAASGASGIGGALDDATTAAQKLKKVTAGFDELNVVSSQSASGGGGASGGAGVGAIDALDFEMPDLSTAFDTSAINEGLEEAKEKIQAVLVLAGLVGAAIATWKILDIITDPAINLGGIFKNIGGYALLIGGALLTIVSYSEAWANGVDWLTLAGTIGGLAAVIGGLYLTMGKFAAQIGVVAAGVALVILGVKDFIDNGATVQNTILIIGGAIAVAVGLATAGVSVLVAAIVGITTAVVAFTAAILLEKPAIMSVEEAQEALTEAKEKAAQAENNYINAVDAAESALDRLKKAEEAAGISGEELYKQVESGTLDYADMTDKQKELYKAYLDNEQKQKDLKAATEELTAAKKNEKLASLENEIALGKESGSYDKCKKSIVDAFNAGEISAEEARDMLSKAMSEMSNDSQQTFMKDLPNNLKNGLDPHKYESTATKIKKFFSDIFTSIKNTFSNIGQAVATAITNTVKTAINSVLNKAVSIINGFISAINFAIGVINAIPGVSISKLNKLSVPALAKGGIVDSATLAVIGERGKEAVLPLENNTGWIDELAAKLNEKSGTPSKIVLMLDGKELGWASINGINNITKQTGALQLQLV